MSRVIPKETLTAYQRWELGAVEFSQSGGTRGTPIEGGEDVSQDAIRLPTAEELERIHQTAWQEGYALGHEQGLKAGFEQGSKEGEAYVRQLSELATSIEAERLMEDETLAREVLDLALVVARQMIRTALLVKEDTVLEVLREAIANLPSMTGHTLLAVHPDDVRRVMDWVGAEQPHSGFRVISDPNIEKGGFRFSSSSGEMDGNMSTRWKQIVACLGTDVEWLE